MVLIIPFYAALCAIFYFFLSMQVIRLRNTEKVGLGSGDNPALFRAIRVHGNFCEYVPLTLVLYLMLELQGHSARALHIFGALLLLSRLLHSIGIHKSSGRSIGRFVGAGANFVLIISECIA